MTDREFELSRKLFQARHDTRTQSTPVNLQLRDPKYIATTESAVPGGIWLVAYKVAIFTRAYIESSGWTAGPLEWMLSREPWWTIERTDEPRYANLFTRVEWSEARTTLETSLRKQLDLMPRHPQTEHIAVLSFIRDSMDFATRMYRTQLVELPEDARLLEVS
jgi:hypothetical protein